VDASVVSLAKRPRVGALLILVALLIAVAVLAIQANSVWEKRPFGPVQPTFVQNGPVDGPQAMTRTGGIDEPPRNEVATKRGGASPDVGRGLAGPSRGPPACEQSEYQLAYNVA
jgi:hypothetical protein